MILRPLLLLAPLLALVPLAAAQETLESLEEPHAGTDKVWDVIVSQAEANSSRVLIYRNTPGAVFNLTVFDKDGTIVFSRNGTRGVQTLPGLPAGEYRFFVGGRGEFQVTARAFERIITENSVNATLRGTTDAYVLASQSAYDVSFTGDVRVEWWPLAGAPDDFEAPAERHAAPGNAYVMTIRGEEATPYSVTLTPAEHAPTPTDTPGLPVLAVLAVLAVLGLVRRRT